MYIAGGHVILRIASFAGTFIIMEYLDFGGRGSQADLGAALAQMHSATPQVSSTRTWKKHWQRGQSDMMQALACFWAMISIIM